MTTKNYPSERKSPTRLTDAEEYAVYKYCVENHCIAQSDDMISWRVNREKIAKEINMLAMLGSGRLITYHHVTTAVERVVAWQVILSKLPPVPIETAELEQLRIYKTKTVNEIEQLKVQQDTLLNTQADLLKEIERLKKSDAQNKIDRIRAIVSA